MQGDSPLRCRRSGLALCGSLRREWSQSKGFAPRSEPPSELSEVSVGGLDTIPGTQSFLIQPKLPIWRSQEARLQGRIHQTGHLSCHLGQSGLIVSIICGLLLSWLLIFPFNEAHN